MADQLKILGQQPQQVKIAGVEVTIYPPSIYRIQTILSLLITKVMPAAELLSAPVFRSLLAKGSAATAEEDATAGKILLEFIDKIVAEGTQLLKEICRERGANGAVPEAVASDEFWQKEVTTSEIQGLIEVFIELSSIQGLLKNVRALKGIV